MIVAITDRRRMVAADVLARGDWTAIAAAFADAISRAVAGLDDVIVQVREKDLDGAHLLALARAAVATGVRVLVNDRADVARAAGAWGVHLPERGLPLAAARALVGVVGVSRHAPGDVSGADLVQLGPIFETPGPGKAPPLGVAALATKVSGTLVAVGGFDSPARVHAAIAAGADAVAVIRGAWGGSLAELARAARR